MYTVEQPKVKIQLISNEGNVITYESYEEFISSISYDFVYYNVVTSFKTTQFNWLFKTMWGETNPVKYIVRDPFGSVYSTAELLHDIIDYRHSVRMSRIPSYVYRYDPVPYVYRWRGHRTSVYRHPKTTQERKLSLAYPEYVRAKRRANNLPDTWDDYTRSDIAIKKSWKKIKKRRQWM